MAAVQLVLLIAVGVELGVWIKVYVCGVAGSVPGELQLLLNRHVLWHCVLLMSLTLVVQSSVYYRGLAVLASLGVPETEEEEFTVPYAFPTAGSFRHSQALKAVLCVCFLCLGIMTVVVCRRPATLGLGDDLVELASSLNNEALILQQTVGMKQNLLRQYQRYFRDRAEVVLQSFQNEAAHRQAMAEPVNAKDFGNVTTRTLFQDLVDERWARGLAPSQNQITAAYNDSLRPTFIYGNVDRAELQRVRSPCDRKIGPHLLIQSDDISIVPRDAVVAALVQVCDLAVRTPSPELAARYALLGPENDAGGSMAGLDPETALVVGYQRIMVRDLPLKVEMLNQFTEDEANQGLERVRKTDYMLVTFFEILLLLCLVAISTAWIKALRYQRDHVIRTSLFSSLFLKRLVLAGQ